MKTNSYIVSIVITIIAACGSSYAQPVFTGKPQYQIEVKRADTSMGKIIVEMFPAIAPNHVRNWDSLVMIHFYDSIAFHRVAPGFVIQGGDPNSRSGDPSTWGTGEDGQQTIDAEFSSVSHQRGIISAARLGNDINSATSQFFICLGNQKSLDRQYSAYGHVVRGMNIVDSIAKVECDIYEAPIEKITMFITRLGSNDSITATPTLVSPADGSSNGTAVKATLRWNHISDAMLYRLQLATDPDFQNIVRDSGLRQLDTNATITKLTTGKTYYWRVLANNGGNESPYSEPWNFKVESLGIEKSTTQEIDLTIFQHSAEKYTTLHFTLDEPSLISIDIFDLLGRAVYSPISSKILSGTQDVKLIYDMLASGLYLCRFSAGGKSMIKQLVIE